MTTVDSWPKTLPMPSVGSWNSTTETHLVYTLRFFISLYIPHLQIEFFDHSLWLEWFYKGNKLQSKLFFQSNKTLADVITAYFLTFQRIVYILNAELNITNVLWSDKAWQSFILNPLKKIESKELQFKLTIYALSL